MGQHSAGVLLYRVRDDAVQVLLAHPGGPFWEGKDDGAWSIPKGLFESDELPLAAAKREFEEETGFRIDGDFIDLGTLKLSSGKIVHGFALAGDLDASEINSNTCTVEWPPRSGQMHEIPEIDRGEWFDVEMARRKISKGQLPFLDRLLAKLG